VLTGMVYGLMALGLSVIFGVVRVVNFAHGEMMTIAMYAAVAIFSAWAHRPVHRGDPDRGRLSSRSAT
jgi:branched-chain amino acid transport system permease protein